MAIVSAPPHGQKTPSGVKLPVPTFIALMILAAAGVALLALYVLPGLSRSPTVQGSGVAATSSRAVATFSGIELAGSNNVTVVVGARQSVVVHADNNLLSHVTTRVTAGRLIIGDVGSFAANSPMYVEVSVPSLAALDLSGSGTITVTGIRAPRLTISLSGSGEIEASGSVTELSVSIDGSGNAQLSRITARRVDAIVSGSGTIFVTATQSLDAKVPGSGAVLYSGNPPRVTTAITGSGAVTPG